ncbi:MAG: DUF465 domain-containing protein [Myxococcota bacterium]
MASSPDSVPSEIEAEISRLQQVHRELKARLSELNSRLYLSPEEEVERKRLQKLKLATKDQIVRLRTR